MRGWGEALPLARRLEWFPPQTSGPTRLRGSALQSSCTATPARAQESLDGRPRRRGRAGREQRGEGTGPGGSSHKTRCYPGARRQGRPGAAPDGTRHGGRASRKRSPGGRDAGRCLGHSAATRAAQTNLRRPAGFRSTCRGEINRATPRAAGEGAKGAPGEILRRRAQWASVHPGRQRRVSRELRRNADARASGPASPEVVGRVRCYPDRCTLKQERHDLPWR